VLGFSKENFEDGDDGTDGGVGAVDNWAKADESAREAVGKAINVATMMMKARKRRICEILKLKFVCWHSATLRHHSGPVHYSVRPSQHHRTTVET
jgi:hypothetical protein